MILYTIPNVMSFANGMKTLDMLPTGYSYEYVNALFAQLGQEGRDYYLYRQIPLDMIYPFLFAVSYSIMLIYLFKKGFNPTSKIQYSTIIPLFGGFFDYCENIGIITMLNSFPNISEQIAGITNLFSILKSVSTTLFFVLLIVGIIAALKNKFSKSDT